MHSGVESGEASPLIVAIRKNGKKTMATDSQLHSSFLRISFLFAVNHGALLSCLGLASARLGSAVASTSSSILYVFNTGFALLGAPYIVKRSGPHNGLIVGMCMCATYVASFWGIVAFCYEGHGELGAAESESVQESNVCSETLSIMGSIIGGVGSAILWTSQGSFFTSLCLQYSQAIEDRNIPTEKVTSRLGGEWAFIFLFIEVWMRILSTVLAYGIHTSNDSDHVGVNEGLDWRGIFGVYTILAFGAAGMMRCITYYDEDGSGNNMISEEDSIDENVHDNVEDLIPEHDHAIDSHSRTFENEYGPVNNPLNVAVVNSSSRKSPFRQAIAAVDLLIHDNKMKYLTFINVTFGLCTAFVTLVVNGQVIRDALHDYNSRYVGMFTALSSSVAAILSWLFGALDWLSHSLVIESQDSSCRRIFVKSIKFFEPNKERILTAGAMAYMLIAFLFLIFPSFSTWNINSLLLIYILLGIGRSTYEGTLRAVFADFFPDEREGAFANIILSTGVASVIGFWIAAVSPFAIEILTIVSSILAIGGFWKANSLYIGEQQALETTRPLERSIS
eukprot:CCRYP_011966-RA/>CCRYP_011966-RA protein AED:0.22 eAED:0.22 QI:1553/1/1/1/0.25/0.2/5/1326/562